MKDSFKVGDIYVADEYEIYKCEAKLLLQNDIYMIYELGEESILFYKYIGDFVTKSIAIRYGDSVARAKRIADENIGFSFISLKPRNRDFYITFYNRVELEAPIKARAFVNDEMIGEFEIDERYKYIRLDDITLTEGINRVTFELDGDFSNLAVADLRFSRENGSSRARE
jgi:hypothetical protein